MKRMLAGAIGLAGLAGLGFAAHENAKTSQHHVAATSKKQSSAATEAPKAPLSRTAVKKQHLPHANTVYKTAAGVPPKEYGEYLQRIGKQKWSISK